MLLPRMEPKWKTHSWEEISFSSFFPLLLFLFNDNAHAHTHTLEGYFALWRYKERLSRRRINTQRHTRLFTVVENFELHCKCHDLSPRRTPPRRDARYQTAMSPNERKVSQRGRTDVAHRSRGIKGPTTTTTTRRTTTRTRFRPKEDTRTCIAPRIHPRIADGPSGEIKRAKSQVRHTYLIAHGYALTHYANHSGFIAGTFKS